ncbi:MAG: HD domain-containing protein [Sandaracinaceae bacterium]
MPFDHAWVRQARILAETAHATQTRKDGKTPYFAHLESVARILAEHGYEDPVTLSAAYLHDLLEDQPEHAATLRREVPAPIVAVVEALSESKTDTAGRVRPKKERFEDYVARLSDGSDASRRALPISCADKIHNTSSLVAAEGRGERLLARLNTRPAEHGPHLALLRQLYAPTVNPGLLATFDRARDALLQAIARRRTLQVQLDDASRDTVRARASLRIVRGDHITLAHGVDPDHFEPRWVPGGVAIGTQVDVQARREHVSAVLQAWTVEIAGSRTRPFDGGVLHVTVSRAEGARSRHANRLVEQTVGKPLEQRLRGTVTWVEP